MVVPLLILSMVVTSVLSQSCNIRDTDEGSVCVCNAKYCDTVPELDVSTGKYQLYSTSKAKLGFYSTTGSFVENTDGEESSITVDQDTKHQNIIGFGGINIKLLPEGAEKNLIESYFGNSGIAYSLCRVPIGGTDFSTRGYSYDDVEGDDTLEHFALQQDDLDYKIPFILQAKALRNNNIKLFASAWSAPTWMKTINDWFTGSLKDEYYQLWADYNLRFYEEYNKRNISFWGMTTQNEPSGAGWSPSQMNLEQGAGGWVDWNMVLNEEGGPTYIDNYVDSPIIVNATLQEFYKQPMFYALGHFSKFAVPDSVRLETTVKDLDNVRAMAFLRPDNLIALIISNSGSEKTSVRIQNSQGQTAAIQIEANSINTVLYS
ncbi:putative glucosylceramidase 4 [Anoplophora glabripennis]|uniref:putative glucosylceramidase 4 n=1 Tax=Anoplophora glabripennis TaxID=217634 RepID=UPI000C7756E3|nr:putative glucosylceramidase 4 [Anoplophora glabripennis]